MSIIGDERHDGHSHRRSIDHGFTVCVFPRLCFSSRRRTASRLRPATAACTSRPRARLGGACSRRRAQRARPCLRSTTSMNAPGALANPSRNSRRRVVAAIFATPPRRHTRRLATSASRRGPRTGGSGGGTRPLSRLPVFASVAPAGDEIAPPSGTSTRMSALGRRRVLRPRPRHVLERNRGSGASARHERASVANGDASAFHLERRIVVVVQGIALVSAPSPALALEALRDSGGERVVQASPTRAVWRVQVARLGAARAGGSAWVSWWRSRRRAIAPAKA